MSDNMEDNIVHAAKIRHQWQQNDTAVFLALLFVVCFDFNNGIQYNGMQYNDFQQCKQTDVGRFIIFKFK